MAKTKLTPLPTEKKQQPISVKIKNWVIKEVWDGRPINWLAIGLCYASVAYTAYELAKYYVNIPEFNGIIAFVSVFVIGSRVFKKK